MTSPETQRADLTSIEALLKELEPRFRSISCSFHIAVPDAEDVLQNTLVRYIHLRRPVEHPGAWLSIVFRRECLRFLRGRALRLELAVDPAEIANAKAPVPHLAPEERMFLTDALATLHTNQRKVLLWRYAMGMTEAEVADAIGCKPVSAKKTLSRALEALRRAVASPLACTVRALPGLVGRDFACAAPHKAPPPKSP